MNISVISICGIAGLATAGVIMRPWRLPEAVWATAGAILLVVLGLLPWIDAVDAVAKGTDVYLFLIGMMLLAEIARREGLFDTLAALAARQAKGSASRLFVLIYIVGIIVTVLLSNDATAVVLTPAVYAAARAAKAKPLPYLFICAFIANAASFVLPISNPANLVLFGSHMPPLIDWLKRFTVPSLLSIAATFIALRLTQSSSLRQKLAKDIAIPPLSLGAHMALGGIGLTAILLLAASSLDMQLGLPTGAAAIMTALAVALAKREAPWATLQGVSWPVLPLVAGLFVLVEGLNRAGLIRIVGSALAHWAQISATATGWGSGIGIGLLCNLMNNLPAGLIAGSAAAEAHLPPDVTSALLIGVDLGPNLSVTGSLATILWLLAIRREGQDVGFWQFLKLGLIIMPPALLLALAGSMIGGSP